MLDKFMDMVGGEALEAITKKTGIPLDQAKQMLPIAKDSLTDGIKKEASSGNLEGILGMFKNATSGNLESDGIFGNIKQMFVKKAMEKMGIPAPLAGLAASSGIGNIVMNLAGKMQSDGDNDGIDASNMMSVLGMGGGAAGLLGGLLGNKGGDASGLLGGLAGAAGGLLGGKDKEEDKGSGGLLGGLKDLF